MLLRDPETVQCVLRKFSKSSAKASFRGQKCSGQSNVSLEQEDQNSAMAKGVSGIQGSIIQHCQICILQTLTQTPCLFISFFSVMKQRMQKNNMFKIFMTVVFYLCTINDVQDLAYEITDAGYHIMVFKSWKQHEHFLCKWLFCKKKKNLSSFLLLISSGFQSDVNWYSQNTALNIQHSAADQFSERGQSEEERQVILIYF